MLAGIDDFTITAYRTFMIFKRSANNTSETLPQSTVTWDIAEGELNGLSGN